MIPNCKGCEEELGQAYQYQQEGLFLASYPTKKGHWYMTMVNDEGKVVVGWMG